MTELTPEQQIAFEAAAFRRLVNHLREHSDVQNIDLMNLAGFCRNCLSNWYREAAEQAGVPLAKEESREIIYGMPYEEWRERNQRKHPQNKRRRSSSTGPKLSEERRMRVSAAFRSNS